MTTLPSLGAPGRLGALNQRLRAIDEQLSGWIIGGMRIVVGMLWLANVEWKRPGDFGRDLGNGWFKYVNSAVRLPVFAPYAWVVEHVVLKQYTFFGWITLLTESMLAVLLILGLLTRPAALLGAGWSVSILLSVLYYDKTYEWPWSYFLMIAAHLLLFATAAGQHLGLDGALRRGTTHLVVRVLGVVAIVVGIGGLYVARNGDFAASRGSLLGWDRWELKLVWFNMLSALITIGLGVLALAGDRLRRVVLVRAAAGGFALMTLQVVVQWRYRRGNPTGGILGGTGGTMAFWMLLGVGLAVAAGLPRRTLAAAEG